MKRIKLLFSLMILGMSIHAFGQTPVTDTDLGSGNYTWDLAGSPYVLDGFVYLEEGGSLTIQPGVVVKGSVSPTSDPTSALIIARGAKIFALGTPDNPVIFTTSLDDTNDPSDLTAADKGLWGGLILLGNGELSDVACPQELAGLPAGDIRNLYGNCSNPVEGESSGVLRFVSIRHAGAELSTDNVINGLTLAAVGSGTLLEYIEVFACQDDGVGLLGGNARIKYLASAFCGDDAMDFDYGWSGKAQYVLTLAGEDQGDHGAECDGAVPDDNLPFSKPLIYNATYIGSSAASTGLLLRDATGGTFANSIITAFSTGIEVEQNDFQPVDCLDRIANGELVITHNLFWNNSNYVGFTGNDLTTVPDHLDANDNALIDPEITSVCYTPTACLNPLLSSSSPALAGAVQPTDPWFDNVSFKGAFDSGNFWIKQWTALEEYGYLASGSGVFNVVDLGEFTGQVVFDESEDCILDAGEPGLQNWLLEITGNSSSDIYITGTDQQGGFKTLIPTNELYTVRAFTTNSYWNVCENDVQISFQGNALDTVDFLVNPDFLCPLLEVNVGIASLRQCFDRMVSIQYCNTGTVPAENAYVQVSYDPLLSIVNASLPFATVAPNVYQFELGNLAVGECGSFNILTHTSCDAFSGQTLCIEAHIFPDTTCTVPQLLPVIEVNAVCSGDSVNLILTNTGQANMAAPSEYIVVEDHVMFMSGEFQLNMGESMTLQRPANGSTYRLETIESPGFPEYGLASVMIEACGLNTNGGISTGIINQFSQDDEEPFLDITCREVVASFDPNDKQGFPRGFGAGHIILENTPLEYMIRFQNTGTDTAFSVVITDTLSGLLDLTTFRPGASSHPYVLEWNNRVLNFRFPDIMLPDSNVNESLSHGFVNFSITPLQDLPLGTVFENAADIYFDLNDPIRTNTTFHTLGAYDLVISGSGEVISNNPAIRVFPNPVLSSARLEISAERFESGTFNLYDSTGRLVRREPIQFNQFEFYRNELVSGLYFFEIRVEGNRIGAGKMIIR